MLAHHDQPTTDPLIHQLAREQGFSYLVSPDKSTLLEPDSAMLMASANNATLAMTGTISHLLNGKIDDYAVALYTAQADERADEQPNGHQIVASLSLQLPKDIPLLLLLNKRSPVAYEDLLLTQYGPLGTHKLTSPLKDTYVLALQQEYNGVLLPIWQEHLESIWRDIDEPIDLVIVDSILSINIVADEPNAATFRTLLDVARRITPVLNSTLPSMQPMQLKSYSAYLDRVRHQHMRSAFTRWLSNQHPKALVGLVGLVALFIYYAYMLRSV